MSKTFNRVMSMVLAVLMVVSMASVFSIPAFAAAVDLSKPLDYNTILENAYIVGVTANAGKVSFPFNNQTVVEDYDATRHFETWDAAAAAYYGDGTTVDVNDVPVFYLAPGTYTNPIVVRFNAVILGANAGKSPNADTSTWTMDDAKAGAASTWTDDGTVIKGGIYRTTRELAATGFDSTETGTVWAYKLSQSDSDITLVVDGVTFNQASAGIIHKDLTDGNNFEVSIGGVPTLFTTQKRDVETKLINSVFKTFSGANEKNGMFSAYDAADNNHTVTFDKVRFEDVKVTGWYYGDVENINITNCYLTDCATRPFGYRAAATSTIGGTGSSVNVDVTVNVENNVFRNNAISYPFSAGNSGGSVKNITLNFYGNLFYNQGQGANKGSGGTGSYGVFNTEALNPSLDALTFNIIGNEFYSEGDYLQNNIVEGKAANYVSKKIVFTFNYNKVSGKFVNIMPNLNKAADLPIIQSGKLDFDFDYNWWPGYDSANTETGLPADALTGIKYKPGNYNSVTILQNGFDFAEPAYYLDKGMTRNVAETWLADVELVKPEIDADKKDAEISLTDPTVDRYDYTVDIAGWQGVLNADNFVLTPKLSDAEQVITFYSDEACTTELFAEGGLDLSQVGMKKTIYIKVVSKDNHASIPAKVYTVQLMASNPVDFTAADLGTDENGVPFSVDDTRVFVGTEYQLGDKVDAVWNDIYYTFTVDNKLVYNSTDKIFEEVIPATANIILPGKEYETLELTVAANYYGVNFKTNPIVKTEENGTPFAVNKEWKLNSNWGISAETGIGSIVVPSVVIDGEDKSVRGDVNIAGITLRGIFKDTDRTTTAGELDITLKNVVIDQLEGNGTGYFFQLSNKRSLNDTDVEFGKTYDDDLYFNNLYIKSIRSAHRLVSEHGPNYYIDNMYVDYTAASTGATNVSSLFAWIKNGKATAHKEVVVKNSRFANANTDSELAAIFSIQGQQAITETSDVRSYDVTFENNQFYNATHGAQQVIGLGLSRLTSVTIKNNTFIGAGAIASAGNSYHLDENGDGVDDALVNDDYLISFDKVVIDGNNFIGTDFTDTRVNYGMHPYVGNTLTNSFYTSDVANYLTGYVGAKLPFSAEESYWLDMARTANSAGIGIEKLNPDADVSGFAVDESVSPATVTFTVGTGLTAVTNDLFVLKSGCTVVGIYDTEACTGTAITSINKEDAVANTYYLKIQLGTLTKVYKLVMTKAVNAFTTAYKNSTIASTALLLTPAAATLATGTTVVAQWDGAKYKFVVGYNAFATLEAIEAFAKENGITTPQVLVPSYNGALNPTISMKLYGPNWNTAPFNRPDGENWSAVKSGSTAWTVNTDFDIASSVVTSITITDDFEGGALEFYGFYVTGTITDSTRTKGANVVLKNIYHKANTHLINYGNDIGTTLANNNASLTKENNSILLKNYYAVGTKANTKFMSRFVPHSTTLDSVWVDFTNLYYQHWIKSAKTDTEYIWKNSYITGHTTAGAPMAYQGANAQISSALSTTLEFTNNVFYDYSATTVGSDGVYSIINWHSRAYRELKIKDNYVAAPSATDVKLINQAHTINDPRAAGAISITGNIFNGMQDEIVLKYKTYTDTDAVEVHGNFLLTTYTADYANAVGKELKVQSPCTYLGDNWYWLDAAMTVKNGALAEYKVNASLENKVVVDNANKKIYVSIDSPIISGKDFDTSKLDIENTANTITVGGVALGEIYTAAADIATSDTIAMSVVSPDGSVTDAWTIEIVANAYENVPVFSSDYVCSDGNGTIAKTAVLLYDSNAVVDGTTVYAEWEGNIYSFVKDTNAFDSIASIPENSQVIVPSWNAPFNVAKAMKVYGSNWNVRPYTKPDGWTAVTSNGEDWKVNTEYQNNMTSVINGNLTVSAGVTGALEFYGFKLAGGYVDKARTTVAQIKLKNMWMDFTTAGTLFNFGNTATVHNKLTTDDFMDNNKFDVVDCYIAATSAGTIRFLDRFVPQQTTFDGLYVPETALINYNAANTYTNQQRASGKTARLVFKNSNLRGFQVSETYPSICQLQGLGNTANADDQKAELIYQNNIMYKYANRYVDNTYYIFWGNTHGFSSIKFEDNYMTYPDMENVKMFTNVRGKAWGDGTIQITGNVILGLDNYIDDIGSNVKVRTGAMTIRDNFYVESYAAGTDITALVGQHLTAVDAVGNYGDNSFYLDSAMTLKSNVLYDYAFTQFAQKIGEKEYVLSAPEGSPFVTYEGSTTTFDIAGITNNKYNKITATYTDADGSVSFDIRDKFTVEKVIAYPITLTLAVTSADGSAAEDGTYKLNISSGFTGTDLVSVTVGGVEATLTDDVYTFTVKNNSASGNEVIKAVCEQYSTVTLSADTVTAAAGETQTIIITVTSTLGQTKEYTLKVTRELADKAALESAIASAENRDTTGCIPASVEAFNELIADAKALVDNTSATPAEVAQMIDSLNNYVLINAESFVDALAEARAIENTGKYCPEMFDKYNAELIKLEIKSSSYDTLEEILAGIEQIETIKETYLVTHTYSQWVYNNDGDCVHNGSESAYCDYGCGKISTREKLDSKGDHTITKWTYNDDATEEKDGTETGICDKCGESVTKVVEGTKLPTNTANKFIDVKEKAWYKEAVDYVFNNGLLSGMSENTFEPNTNMNRAMFVTVLARMAGITLDNSVSTQFIDVPAGKWYTGAVKWAAESNIVTGTSKLSFSPTANITREQMCTLIVRFAEFKGITLKEDKAAENFTDNSSISLYARKAVTACQKAGIISGMGDGTFNPKGNATRAQVAKVFMIFHQDYIK